MNINFIITCYDKENYYPYFLNIINSYTKINPTIVLSYNGNNDNFNCDVKRKYIPNGGRLGEMHPHGCPYAYSDCELTVDGYNYLRKKNNNNLWIKLSVDSWLLDEDKIIKIFELMQEHDCPYGGNIWYIRQNMSTDICFFDTSKYNLLQEISDHHTSFFDHLHAIVNPHGFEHLMYFISRQYNQLIIANREPLDASTTRWCVPDIGWTMYHDISKNINFLSQYNKQKSSNIKSFVIPGTFIPYNLEKIKPEI